MTQQQPHFSISVVEDKSVVSPMIVSIVSLLPGDDNPAAKARPSSHIYLFWTASSWGCLDLQAMQGLISQVCLA